MKYTQHSIEASHEDIVAWLKWFLLEQAKRGLPKDKQNEAGFIITAFMDSGPNYLVSLTDPRINCPKCQGRGHTNLFLIGSTKPAACDNCKGSGKIEPSKAVGMDAAEPEKGDR